MSRVEFQWNDVYSRQTGEDLSSLFCGMINEAGLTTRSIILDMIERLEIG